MSNEVEIIVESKQRGDAIAKTKKDVDGLGNTFTSFDGRVRQSNKGLEDLDKQIVGISRRIKALRDDFGKTGNVSLLPDIKDEEKRLGELKKQFSSFAGDSGRDSGEIFTFGFFKTFQSMPGQMQAALVSGVAGAAIVAAPILGAALSSAVAVGLGAGGIAAGITLAASSSEVRSAWAGLGESAMKGLQEAAGSFEPVLIRGAQTFQRAFDNVLPAIQSSFDTLAPTLDHLFEGASQGVERFGTHLEDIFSGAAPFIDTVARTLPEIGDALGDMFAALSNNDGALLFFQDFMADLPSTIDAVSETLDTLAGAYEKLRDPMLLSIAGFAALSGNLGLAKDAWDAMGAKADRTAEAAPHASAGLRDTGEAAREAADKADRLAASFDALYTHFGRVKESQLAFNESLLGMSAAVKQNGTDLDEHTQKGIDNNQMLLRSIDTIASWRKANDDGSYSAENLAGKVEVMREQFVQAAVKAGFNRDKVEEMSRALLGVPQDTHSDTHVETAASEARIANLERRLDAVDGRVATSWAVTNVVTHYSVTGNPSAASGPGGWSAAQAHGGISGAAGGGPRGRLTWVGEHGPELVDLAPGSMVHSNPDSMRMAAAGGAGGPIVLKLVTSGMGTDLEQALARWFAKSIRVDGAFRDVLVQAVTG